MALILALKLALIMGLILFSAGQGWGQAATGEPGVGVFPFQSLRAKEQGAWLALFFQEGIRDSLIRMGRKPVLGKEAAEQWRIKLGIGSMELPGARNLNQMGVEKLVLGESHLVLNMAVLKIRVVSASGDLLKGGEQTIRLDLTTGPPGAILAKVLKTIGDSILGEPISKTAPQPENLKDIKQYYSLISAKPPPLDPEMMGKFISDLQKLEAGKGLEGRVNASLAEMFLQDALLNSENETIREIQLKKALKSIIRSLTVEPWHTDRMALKGEIHHFLKQDYQAKTEASVARVKNPMNGLAYLVLAMNAGLSTGEADEKIKKALKVDPFMRIKNRVAGAIPFQGGALETTFDKWDDLRPLPGRTSPLSNNEKMRQGIEFFEAKKWEEAEKRFLQAAEMNEYDYEPLMYLARIQIDTGSPQNAVEPLRTLSTEFPHEAEIFFFLGVSLELSQMYTEAEMAFQRSLTENPDDLEVLFHLASVIMGQERWESALESFGALLRKEPQHELGWLGYGISNAKLERWVEADKAFGAVLQINPDSTDAAAWQTNIRQKHLAPVR